MKNGRTHGILLLIGGILAIIAVSTHFIFDNYSTDKSPYLSALLFVLIGLNAIYSGYQILKK